MEEIGEIKDLVHLARLADVDLQVLADEGEEGRREVNL